jgi:hypothetical protein
LSQPFFQQCNETSIKLRDDVELENYLQPFLLQCNETSIKLRVEVELEIFHSRFYSSEMKQVLN